MENIRLTPITLMADTHVHSLSSLSHSDSEDFSISFVLEDVLTFLVHVHVCSRNLDFVTAKFHVRNSV